MSNRFELEFERLQSYCEHRPMSLANRLGFGQDGIVYFTDVPTAVKALNREELYVRERDVYRRLQEHEITELRGFAIPSLVDCDDELWIVEMSVVTPPFVVDFAGVYLDTPPPYFYDDEIMATWKAQRREMFEEDWVDVVFLLEEFRKYGIYLNDVKPGNVTIRQG